MIIIEYAYLVKITRYYIRFKVIVPLYLSIWSSEGIAPIRRIIHKP